MALENELEKYLSRVVRSLIRFINMHCVSSEFLASWKRQRHVVSFN